MRMITASAVVVWGVLGASLALAVPTAPRLRASVRAEGVRVRATIQSSAAQPTSTLELERSRDGGAFASLPSISGPRRRQTTTDVPPAGGTYTYRARVVTIDGTSDWSGPVTVTVVAPLEPGPPGDPPLPAGLAECPAGYVEEVLRLVNLARAEYGVFALRNVATLAKAARMRSITMAQNQSLTHTGWVTTIREAGYGGGYLAENIAMGYKTPLSVVTGWLDSSGHAANMLNGYRDSGVGCVLDGRGRPWWTQDFGA